MKQRENYQTPAAETIEVSLEQFIAVSTINAPVYNGMGQESDWNSID